MTTPSCPIRGAGGSSRGHDGPRRYGERKRRVDGVSGEMLIQRRKGQACDRVIVRSDDKEARI